LYVIVAGLGRIGMRAIEVLSNRGYDVVGIDIDKEVSEKAGRKTGAVVINGDATNPDVLIEAGVNNADICIGLIGEESANLAFTSISSAFNVPKILVRMEDPSYKNAYFQSGADTAMNTTEFYMDSLVMEIERPSFKEIATLGDGKASIVIVEIPEGSPVKGKNIGEIIMLEDFPANCLFAGIQREDSFITPKGNQEILAKDRVFLSGNSECLKEAAKCLGVEP